MKFLPSVVKLFLALILILSVPACREPKWEVPEALLAEDYEVALALGDLRQGTIQDINAVDIPIVSPPVSLRPCCAFGANLQVKVGKVPVPGVELGNILDPEKVGTHGYDNGLVSVNTADSRGVFNIENDGILYTCRGGFIDTAHVRDYADKTFFLITVIARKFETGGSIALPDEGGKITVFLKPGPEQMLQQHGRRLLAIKAAQWVAFELSVWHEIATWYGYASIKAFPEKISAFSPEDLYSNLLGIKICGGIVMNKDASSENTYNRSMDAWLKRVLERLQVLPKEDSVAAMQLVDGLWWDSTKRIPDWKLTLRRNMDIGTEIFPWLVTEASGMDEDKRNSFEACKDSAPPLVLRNPDGFEGVEFSDYLTVQIELDDKLASAMPLPNPPSSIITQADFPEIIEVIRSENAAEFGPEADIP